MVNSRVKGAQYESEIKKALFDNLGIVFKRELNQYREADHGDLICEEENFPFVIECKRRMSGSFSPTWMDQAQRAADRVSKYPCVIYRFDRQPSIAVIRINAFARAVGGSWDENTELVSMTVDAFCSLARELMAVTPLRNDPDPEIKVDPIDCRECNGFGFFSRTKYIDYGRGPEPTDMGDAVCEDCGGLGKIYPEDEDE